MRISPYNTVLIILFLIFSASKDCQSKNQITPEKICQQADYVVKIMVYELNGSSPPANGTPSNQSFKYFGSGSIVACKEYNFCILTAYHVVKSTTMTYYATFKDGSHPQRIKIIKSVPKYDAAILKFSNAKYKPVKTTKIGRSEKLTAGSPIIALGSNRLGDFWCSASGSLYLKSAPNSTLIGIIQRWSAEFKPDFKKILIHSTQTFPGYSGGPLLNKDGELIGITTGFSLTDPPLFNTVINIGSPIDEIREELKIIK